MRGFGGRVENALSLRRESKIELFGTGGACHHVLLSFPRPIIQSLPDNVMTVNLLLGPSLPTPLSKNADPQAFRTGCTGFPRLGTPTEVSTHRSCQDDATRAGHRPYQSAIKSRGETGRGFAMRSRRLVVQGILIGALALT